MAVLEAVFSLAPAFVVVCNSDTVVAIRRNNVDHTPSCLSCMSCHPTCHFEFSCRPYLWRAQHLNRKHVTSIMRSSPGGFPLLIACQFLHAVVVVRKAFLTCALVGFHTGNLLGYYGSLLVICESHATLRFSYNPPTE